MGRNINGEYRCNNCKGNLSAKETTPEHISLDLSAYSGLSQSGLASTDTGLTGWRIARRIPAGRYHFCVDADGRSECMLQWFATVLKDERVGDAL